MGKHTIVTVAAVKAAINGVVAERGDHVDARVDRRLGPRYVEHGRPCCLVAEVMAHLGVTIGVLRALDRESGAGGAGVKLSLSRHPIRRRFEPVAWELLCEVQERQDRGKPWPEIAEELLTPQSRQPWQRAWEVPSYPWNATPATGEDNDDGR